LALYQGIVLERKNIVLNVKNGFAKCIAKVSIFFHDPRKCRRRVRKGGVLIRCYCPQGSELHAHMKENNDTTNALDFPKVISA